MKNLNETQMTKCEGGNCFFTGLTLPLALSPLSNPVNALNSLAKAYKCWNS